MRANLPDWTVLSLIRGRPVNGFMACASGKLRTESILFLLSLVDDEMGWSFEDRSLLLDERIFTPWVLVDG